MTEQKKSGSKSGNAGPDSSGSIDPRILQARRSLPQKPSGLPPRPGGPGRSAEGESQPPAGKEWGGGSAAAPAPKRSMMGDSTARFAQSRMASSMRKQAETSGAELKAAAVAAAEESEEDVFPEDPLEGLDEEERFNQFLQGNITLAQLQNISHAEIYGLAELANNFYTQGQYEKAGRILEGLVVMEPTDSWLHLCLGMCFAQIGNDYRAVLELDRATFLNEYLTQAYVERAEILLKYNEFTQAIADLAKAVELGKDEEDPYSLRAEIQLDIIRGLANSPPPRQEAQEQEDDGSEEVVETGDLEASDEEG